MIFYNIVHSTRVPIAVTSELYIDTRKCARLYIRRGGGSLLVTIRGALLEIYGRGIRIPRGAL